MEFTDHLNRAYHTSRDAACRLFRKVRQAEGWELAAYLLVGVLLLTLVLPAALTLAIAALVVALVAAWVHEFVFLMRLAPEAFPSRHDRLVWIVLMLLVPPVGLLAFWSFRRAAWPESKPSDPGVNDWL